MRVTQKIHGEAKRKAAYGIGAGLGYAAKKLDGKDVRMRWVLKYPGELRKGTVIDRPKRFTLRARVNSYRGKSCFIR